tara:strand:- start:97 stop:348 length:252 start_codon:yes stop_codon:yes gene_type:complete
MIILQMLCIAVFIVGPVVVITTAAYREIDSVNMNLFISFLMYVIWLPLSFTTVIKTIWEGLDYDDIFEFIGALFSNLTNIIGL